MTQSVVSAGATPLFAGMGFGVADAPMLVIVVFMGALRLTRPESASVPVFTDQRSTPHCARRLEGTTRRVVATTRSSRRRKRSIISELLRPFGLLRTPVQLFTIVDITIFQSLYNKFQLKNSRFGPKGHALWPD